MHENQGWLIGLLTQGMIQPFQFLLVQFTAIAASTSAVQAD